MEVHDAATNMQELLAIAGQKSCAWVSGRSKTKHERGLRRTSARVWKASLTPTTLRRLVARARLFASILARCPSPNPLELRPLSSCLYTISWHWVVSRHMEPLRPSRSRDVALGYLSRYRDSTEQCDTVYSCNHSLYDPAATVRLLHHLL